MATAEEKRSYSKGTVILLAGPPDGKITNVEYTVMEELDKNTIRVKGVDGSLFRVHKSRVLKVTKEAEIENQVLEAPKGTVAKELKEQESTTVQSRVEKKEEEKPMEAATAVLEKEKVKPQPKAKAPKTEKTPKAPKKVKEVIPFDAKAWAKSGVLLVKTSNFDHPHKLTCYISVDAKGGFFHTINTYKLNGVESLGDEGKGGNSYPLKGHQITIKKKGKTEIHHGQLTAEEVIADKQKKGYKLVK